MLRRLISSALRRNGKRASSRSAHAPEPESTGAGAGSNDRALAQLQQSHALETSGDLEGALAGYRACARAYPASVAAQLAVANALADLWRVDESIEAYARALSLAPESTPIFSALLFQSHFATPFDGRALFDLHRRYGELVAQRVPEPSGHHKNVRDPERRLRIGYVSANLSRHSVGYFIEPLIAGHDRARHEIYCYYTHPYSDDVTARLAAHADVWRHVHDVDDAALAARVAADEIDVLVDVIGHTKMNRLAVFARKPAPVQMTWLGYPDTTGVATIDYRLTDALADPPQLADEVHTERLLRVEAPFLCYRAAADSPPVSARDAHEDVVFGSFNALAKVNAHVIASWARILHAVPHSRLLLKAGLLKHAQTRARVIAAFDVHGIARDRVELRGWAGERAGHLGTYGEIDIALDTFPYNGTTTTCEALWMGVPVVTLRGEAHMSRVGATLLASVALEELIADSPDAYVDVAAALARDSTRRSALRSGMRARLSRSALLDEPAFVNRFERALRRAWAQWCANRDQAVKARS